MERDFFSEDLLSYFASLRTFERAFWEESEAICWFGSKRKCADCFVVCLATHWPTLSNEGRFYNSTTIAPSSHKLCTLRV